MAEVIERAKIIAAGWLCYRHLKPYFRRKYSTGVNWIRAGPYPNINRVFGTILTWIRRLAASGKIGGDRKALMAAANGQTKGHVMTSSNQKTFLVLYLVPASVMEEWSKTDPNDKKAAEEKMRSEWGNWMSTHSKMIISTDAGGKTKCVTSSGVSDTKNDIVLCSIVEAESHEAAAKSFENHPHLQIPQSSIEVMEIRPIGGM